MNVPGQYMWPKLYGGQGQPFFITLLGLMVICERDREREREREKEMEIEEP